ncbi:MAG: hypothetical protein LBI71_07335 [Enterobacteriaceae bacterium]|nr:hypothetical protein [Enterobacteriaceae bacterium]
MRQSERKLRYCGVSVEYSVLPPALTGHPHRLEASLDIVKFSFFNLKMQCQITAWLIRPEPIRVVVFFGCGVTFSDKSAKSDALSFVNNQQRRAGVEVLSGTTKCRKVKCQTVVMLMD